MRLKDTGVSSQELKDMVSKYMIETYERFDFIAETAKGMYIYDEKGDAYLDFYGGVAVNSVGNVNERVLEAIKDQAADIMHTFNYPYTIPQALLAKLICDTIGMDKIFFQNSGTEANEGMIKLARKYGTDNFGPERYHIVTATKGFHGRTFGALSATGQPGTALHNGFGPLLEGFKFAEFNNLDSFRDACDENTIAIMLEPIQGEGGVNPATDEFMTGIRDLCDEKGMLLLLDEIQTGWGRTGTVMAYQGYDVKPDIVTMAKAMGGGMPIGAMCASDKVAKSFGMGTHGSTYAGHALSCAAAYAACNEIIEKKLPENAEIMGNYFMEKLSTLPHIKEVRGKGLLIGVEFDSDKAVEIKHRCLDKKLLLTAIGKRVIRTIPPLVLDKADIDKAFLILKESVEESYAIKH